MEDQYISISDAARRLGVSRSTLYKLINRGVVPAYRLTETGNWKINRAKFEAWLAVRENARAA